MFSTTRSSDTMPQLRPAAACAALSVSTCRSSACLRVLLASQWESYDLRITRRPLRTSRARYTMLDLQEKEREDEKQTLLRSAQTGGSFSSTSCSQGRCPACCYCCHSRCSSCGCCGGATNWGCWCCIKHLLLPLLGAVLCHDAQTARGRQSPHTCPCGSAACLCIAPPARSA